MTLLIRFTACTIFHVSATLATAADVFQSGGFARAPEGALDRANVPAPLFRVPVFDGAPQILHYTRNNPILDRGGKHPDDDCYGSHPGLALAGDRAFIFNHCHAGNNRKQPHSGAGSPVELS